LKARSALLMLQRELGSPKHARTLGAEDLADRVDTALRARHDVEELSLITALHSTPPTELPAERLEEAEAIIGGAGTSAAARLRRSAGADRETLRDDALTAIQEWRRLQSDLANGEGARNLCRVVIRSLEGVVASLDASGQPAA
jgi:hypothetical protein